MSARKSRRPRLVIAIVSAILTAALLLPAASLAQSSSVGGYGGNGGEVQNALGSGSAGTTDPSGSGSVTKAGTLPFTGLDLGWMIGGGIVLVGAGIAMGRAAPRAPQPR